jgi:hypothetical protein
MFSALDRLKVARDPRLAMLMLWLARGASQSSYKEPSRVRDIARGIYVNLKPRPLDLPAVVFDSNSAEYWETRYAKGANRGSDLTRSLPNCTGTRACRKSSNSAAVMVTS